MSNLPWKIAGGSRLRGRDTVWAWDAAKKPVAMTYSDKAMQILVTATNARKEMLDTISAIESDIEPDDQGNRELPPVMMDRLRAIRDQLQSKAPTTYG